MCPSMEIQELGSGTGQMTGISPRVTFAAGCAGGKWSAPVMVTVVNVAFSRAQSTGHGLLEMSKHSGSIAPGELQPSVSVITNKSWWLMF